ncbi:LPXTG cell wall anchor domain-containing protein [Bifidobacterium sp. ESL0682]|uniref:LPXTG cell wall anchor domain-containing protein n=1 Tax=Bifidobacterium sp. ESL0682 TaxID=2983212 RepID=UPI0023F7628A|nr:LPXTG cell wall anchor domain-containing protein [Bifidobacterium sp. ESL0682]WEV42185.1 LPXTG cell wall anchor domain-containing protein [Bifidobacterium sp. ESL0682]
MKRTKARAVGFSRLLAGAVAGLAAVSMLLPGVANADGGAGSGGSGTAGSGTGEVKWTYQDSFGTPSDANVTSVLQGMGMRMEGADAPVAINQATSGALNECQARYGEAHPGQEAQANCRLVSVGAIYTPSFANSFTGHPAGFTSSQWAAAWNSETQGKTYTYQGASYQTRDLFSDGVTSINSLVARESEKNVALIVVVLSRDEPPTNYSLGLSTSQQMPAGVVVGSTSPVRDLIHATNNGSPIMEDVNANVTLYYGGEGDGYVPGTHTTKTASIHNNGDSWSPTFTPADLGMRHWQEGSYWFDIAVPRQGGMNADTGHIGYADAAERWSVAAMAPSAPTKSVQQGTSTDGMSNTTAIESGTGRGGYELHFRDIIAPNGVNYDVTGMKVMDATANTDVSGQFSMNWDRSANMVKADRSKDKGEMPADHIFRFEFRVTVHQPNANKVGDTASVAWNAHPFVDTPHYEFPTRGPDPDKAWTTDPNEALATADPNHTNQAGSDGRTFVPGDRVSSVVNGTLPKDLIENLSQYSLTDDWSAASRYVDFPNGSAKVYVDGIDRTADFTVATVGSKTTATAKPSILASSAHQAADRKVKLVLDGAFKSSVTAADAISMTNSGAEKWNGQISATNTPPVLVRSPNPDKAWVKDTPEALATSDRNHTNAVAADGKTYVTGDDAVVVVNGILPKNLAKDLSQYSVSDDWTGAAQYADFPNGRARVYVDGVDRTADFSVSTTGHVTTASAKPSILTGSGKQTNDRKVKLVLTGTMTKDVDAHTAATIVNKGSERWNGKTAATNEPQVHIWSPNPDKSWVKLGANGRWQTVIDPSRSNATGADNLTFLDGDQLGAVVNLPITNPKSLEYGVNNLTLTDDYAKADYLVDPQALSKVRVYMAAVTRFDQSSVTGINGSGTDVTDKFDITRAGTRITAAAKTDWLAQLSRHAGPVQVTMLVPFTANYANGKGAKQVREDFHKAPGDELSFCTSPDGSALLNAGSITVNRQGKTTNLPKVCGYVPPTKKDVVGEASQGGSQESVDGKVVYPGQKVEYDLDTQPHLPSSLAYTVKTVTFTDKYDQYLKPDKQTLELMDLNTGRIIPKSKYANRWDDTAHQVAVNVIDAALIAQWQAGGAPRIQVRFEGTVAKDAPTDHKVNNQWVLMLNNSLTPSNEVFNIPPSLNPAKHDFQSAQQGDPTVSIDGKTLLKGDTGNYVIDLDATQSNMAYKVWRLGVIDDFDEEYLKVDPTSVTVTGDDGRDYTSGFNIQVSDGVLYAFAKRVDTFVPATGETVHGNPQPADLKAYASLDTYHPLTDPAINQTLLGQHYHITLPYTVQKVTDGYVVKNKATQVENAVRKETNQVSNPLKPINPAKDVVVKVGGESVNGSSIYQGSTFLYRLDSSVLPANRAYPAVDKWSITDKLDPDYDEYTGQWAVYATRNLYGRDGGVLAEQGRRIAGNGFDSAQLGSDMFTLEAASDGTLSVIATPAYRDLVSADTAHEQGWCAYLQVRRLKATERHENRFTETMNTHVNESNIVWTRTPELTPSLHIEKWDKGSGWSTGDRDEPDDSLLMVGDTDIVFTVTNTSNSEDGHGAVFRAKDLTIADTTISGDGAIASLKYPDDWSTLVLKPGDHVDVIGTLKDATLKHRDRAKVTGIPLAELPTVDRNPWGENSVNGVAERDAQGLVIGLRESVPSTAADAPGSAETMSDSAGPVDSKNGTGIAPSSGLQRRDSAVWQNVRASHRGSEAIGAESFAQGSGAPSAEIDGKVMSVMQPVVSNLDDWNGRRETQPVGIVPLTGQPLVNTGSSIVLMLLVAGAFFFGALLLMLLTQNKHRPRHR